MVAFIPSRKIRMSCIRMTLVFRIRWLSIAASGGQATQSMFSGGQIRSSFGFGNIVQNAICACR